MNKRSLHNRFGRNRHTHHRFTRTRTILIGLLLLYFIFIMPLPYVIVKPGSAERLHDMVEVDGGYEQQHGSFMLTTIRMWYFPRTNLANIVHAYFHPYAHVSHRSEVFGDESGQEYFRRQEYVMLTSQSDAIRAAYEQAEIPYEIRTNDVIAFRTVDGMSAAEVLQPGDRLIRLDDTELHAQDDVFAFMENRSIGDTVRVVYEREGRKQEADIVLEDLAEHADGPSRPGLGIVPMETQTVEPLDPSKKVVVSAGEIGGPSAGLMFALEIYNRLVEEDITQGYDIAGTGTIAPDGTVGVIGGIDYKVVAAHRAGADIFFAPQDYVPEPESGGPVIPNASIAIEQAERLGTSMQIVPVSSLTEALEYLASLPRS